MKFLHVPILYGALVLAACASAPAQRGAALRRRPRGSSAASAVRTRTVVVPPLGRPRLLAREPGAASYYAVGGVRVRVRGTDAVAGMQPFAASIVGAARMRGGHWLFVAASGTVARADDFVGPMRFVESLGAPVVRAFAWEEGLVAVFADGSARRVGEGPDAGPVPPSALTSPEAAPPEAPEHESALAASGALAAFPLARLTLPSAALLASGEVVALGGNRMLFAALGTDGALIPRARVALGDIAASDECTLQAWGQRAVLACPDPADPTRVLPFVATPDGVEPVGASGPPPLIAGAEGHTLTFRAPCSDRVDAGADDAATLACTNDRERGWREWQFPRRASVIDVFDSLALLSESTGPAGPALRAYWIDLARERLLEPSDPAAEMARAGFAPDGRVVLLVHSGTGRARRSLVAVARVGEPLRLQPLGFYARDVVMADARHGLAVGANAAEVAETTDGGLNWLRVDVPVDGDPARVPLGQDAAPSTRQRPRQDIEPIGQWVQCSPVACRAGSALVHLWGQGLEVMPAME